MYRCIEKPSEHDSAYNNLMSSLAHGLERSLEENSVAHILMAHDLRFSTVRSWKHGSKNDSDLMTNSSTYWHPGATADEEKSKPMQRSQHPEETRAVRE